MREMHVLCVIAKNATLSECCLGLIAVCLVACLIVCFVLAHLQSEWVDRESESIFWKAVVVPFVQLWPHQSLDDLILSASLVVF